MDPLSLVSQKWVSYNSVPFAFALIMAISSYFPPLFLHCLLSYHPQFFFLFFPSGPDSREKKKSLQVLFCPEYLSLQKGR